MMKEIMTSVLGAIALFLVCVGVVVFVVVILYPIMDHWQEAFQAYLNTK